MAINIDSFEADISYPQCRRKIKQTIGRLKGNPTLTCSCGATVAVDANELRRVVDQAQKSIDNLTRQLRR